MAATTPYAFVPLSQTLPFWPSQLADMPGALDELGVRDFHVNEGKDLLTVDGTLLWFEEIAFDLPGIDGFSVAFLSADGYTAVPFEVDVLPEFRVKLPNLDAALRIQSDVLKPVRKQGDNWVPALDANGKPKPVQIELSGVGLAVTASGDIDVTLAAGGPKLSLGAVALGDTGVVLEVLGVTPYLSTAQIPPAGAPPGFRGVGVDEVKLHLPPDLDVPLIPSDLEFDHLVIGTSGFSGSVTGSWTPTFADGKFAGNGSGSLFGIPFGLESLSITFKQNVPTASEIRGQVFLPFFDNPVSVDVALGVDGSVKAALSAVQPQGVTYSGGLVTLQKPGLLSMELDSLGFKVSGETFAVSLGGKLTPELGNMEWPTFELKELEIDSNGNVHLDGGWLDLPSGYALDLFGFTIEITKVGFGKADNGGKWVGFSGGVSLVSGLPAGASVDGLRVTWFEDGSHAPQLTLNGVAVEFEVPGAVSFKGAVAYHELPQDVHRFDGSLALNIEAIDLEIDGQIVIGSTPTYTFLALYVDLELPAGIPLGATGLALYGAAGLFALNMEPGKTHDQDWYAIPPTMPVDWFHQGTTGVSTLTKWTNREGSLGLGAGVTIGTYPDDGFTFAAKVLLVIVFPGPIIMLDGAANLLKERTTLDDDPIFHLLAVLDNRAGSITLGLDAKYKYESAGELIEVHGSAETFFSYADPSLWYIYVGERDPKTKRIRANLFQLFEVDAYVMLDPRQFAMGAWIGFQKNWTFGPVGVDIEIWMDSNALLSFKPPQFHGDMSLHGKLAIKVFGFGLSAVLDASLSADVFHPFHIVGKLHAALDLPWPLPDFSADLGIEWGPKPTMPPLPVPLKEIAIEHLKVTTSWPLAKGTRLLVPDYDAGDGFLGNTPPVPASLTAGPPAEAPVVPLDARPHITFTRAVHDDALVGVNPQAPSPEWEQIGDPTRNDNPVEARYAVAEVALDKWDPSSSTWVVVARKGATANASGVAELFGSWAPVPAAGGGSTLGQVKLWLWSKTPFDHARHTSGSWSDWFGSAFPGYPCAPSIVEVQTCFEFSALEPSAALSPPWTIPGSGIRLGWFSPVPLFPSVTLQPIEGLSTALCFTGGGGGGSGRLSSSLPSSAGGPAYMVLLLDQPADEVTVTLVSPSGAEAIGTDLRSTTYGPFAGGTLADPKIVITGSDMREVAVSAPGGLCLFRVCVTRPAAGSPNASQAAVDEQHVRDALATWSAQGYVLEPSRDYRLKVVTTLDTKNAGTAQPTETQTQLAYFQTDGPPGLGNLSLPPGAANGPEMTLVDSQKNPVGVDGKPASRPVLRSELNSLAPYVEQTVPPTVTAGGQRPQLPRPVYRAYDIGVKFNENYVDLLYRLDRRDLALYLFDANNRPVRDARGRLIALGNPWGVAEQLSLSESDTRWIEAINSGDCASLDISVIPHNTTLSSASDEQVLSPDFVYEARLVPLLLHDDFAGYAAAAAAAGPSGKLGPWTVHDDAGTGGASNWEIGSAGTPVSFYVTQTMPITGGAGDPTDPRKPGATLIVGDPSWTDVRINAYLRSSVGGALGIVFRRQDPAAYYRFSMDRAGRYRRLVRVVGGAHTILAQDSVAYPLDTDQLVTIEAAGAALRVYLEGGLLFAVDDTTLATGQVGLYCHADATACFSDVRIDDFRQGAPVAYRFAFTTSKATNFFHLMHGFNDQRWLASIDAAAALDAQVSHALGAAQAPTSAPSDAEAKAYELLATLAIGQDAAQHAQRVEVTRVSRDGEPIALLVRSPEPIDWARTALKVSRAPDHAAVPTPPGALKIVELTPGAGRPADAAVSVLVREASDVNGSGVQWLAMPGAPTPPPRPALFSDSFAGSGGMLFAETFAANALDAYTIVDQGTQLGPSRWSITGGRIVQTNGIYGGVYQAAEDGKPGTTAITGSPHWTDVRITAGVEAGVDGAIGIVFRYADADNHYRLAIDAHFDYRRLTKTVKGTTTVLWQDSTPIDIDRPYELGIDAFGSTLVGCIDGEPLFIVDDPELVAGRVGLYSWSNADAIFSELTVESLERNPLVWQPALADLSGITVFDDPSASGGPSAWATVGGELHQTSAIGDPSGGALDAGTWATGGDAGADDVRIDLTMRSDAGGAIGAMFRVHSETSYYRVSLDATANRRRLVKVTGGRTTILWEDATHGYVAGQPYRLTIDAVGDKLQARLDGAPLFSVSDSELTTGLAALYASGATDARFSSVSVLDLGRRAGGWRLRDESAAGSGSSRWQIGGDALTQTGTIGSSGTPFAGTLALVDRRSFGDVRATVRLQADDPHPVGVILRYRGPGDYYRFLLDESASQRRLEVFAGGVPTTLWSDSGGFDVGASLTMSFDAAGDRLTGYVNGELAFAVTDGSLAVGAAGVYCSGNPAVRFGHVELEAPPLDAYALLADRFEAGAWDEWSVLDEGTSEGPSGWAPQDGELRQTSAIHDMPVDATTVAKQGTMAIAGDLEWTDVTVLVRLGSPSGGTLGVCARYAGAMNYYRFSMDSSRGYRRLVKCVKGTFTTLWEDAVAYDTSRVYDLTIVASGRSLRGYLDGVPLFAVSDDDLTAGAVGLYAWDNIDARFSGVRVLRADAADAGWTIDDHFAVLRTGRWTFADDAAADESSDWHLDGGALIQTAAVGAGTYATAGDQMTTDCRVAAGVGGAGTGTIGVVSRFADADNHYRLAIDCLKSEIALVKKHQGAETSLWTGSLAFDASHDYQLTMDLVGGRIACWLDGRLLCAVEDANPAAGQAGVFVVGDDTARFSDFRVGPPVWAHAYRWADEPAPGDGRRIEVSGGPPDASLVTPAGVDQRFAAGPGERGWSPPDPVAVDLRLVAADGSLRHARRFLPASAYTAATCTVLRKADGTGFFLIDGSFAAGTYSLAFTYRRDNTANDPSSIILSQANDTTDELAQLDIPWYTGAS